VFTVSVFIHVVSCYAALTTVLASIIRGDTCPMHALAVSVIHWPNVLH